jgi:hypothetical protein
VRRNPADELRADAVTLLVQLGLKRPDAVRQVNQLLAERDDITSVQDIITEHFRAQRSGATS